MLKSWFEEGEYGYTRRGGGEKKRDGKKKTNKQNWLVSIRKKNVGSNIQN